MSGDRDNNKSGQVDKFKVPVDIDKEIKELIPDGDAAIAMLNALTEMNEKTEKWLREQNGIYHCFFCGIRYDKEHIFLQLEHTPMFYISSGNKIKCTRDAYLVCGSCIGFFKDMINQQREKRVQHYIDWSNQPLMDIQGKNLFENQTFAKSLPEKLWMIYLKGIDKLTRLEARNLIMGLYLLMDKSKDGQEKIS